MKSSPHFKQYLRYGLSVLWVGTAVSYVSAAVIIVDYPVPTFDRWNYPFNGTVGTRATTPVFGALGQLQPELFDDRDGQALLTFETQADITPGLHRGRYAITEVTVTIVNKVDNLFRFDPTYDSFDTYLAAPDSDPGRPLILTGTGFRNGFTAATFGETGPFPFGAPEDTRNAYAASYLGGQLVDVSNNVRDLFEVAPYAVGAAPVAPGAFVPADTTFTFSVDVSDPDIQCYLKTALRDGFLSFTVSSLHNATQPAAADATGWRRQILDLQPSPSESNTTPDAEGRRRIEEILLAVMSRSEPPVPALAQGDVGWPDLYMKESLEVVFGLVDAAGLHLTVDIVDLSLFKPADVTRNGPVNIDDLVSLLGAFGVNCNCCPEDINDNGVVNIDDLVALLGAFGT